MDHINPVVNALKGPILITGATGFIGANLFKHILKFRKDVFAVVRKTPDWRLVDVSDEHIVNADLNDKEATELLVAKVKPKTVFDCMAYGAYSFEEDSELIYKTNFLAVVNLVEVLAKHDLKAFVHAGTSSEYGYNCAAPREDSPRIPNSHYAVSKAAIADYIKYAGFCRKIPCLSLCLYSVYGPLEDTSRLIPVLLRNAINNKLPAFVDARISRDFIHVDDVCDIFVLAAAKMTPEIYGHSFNIGTGKGTTISELAEITRDIFNIPEEAKFGTMEGRSWDLANWYSNPVKAKTMLNWHAKIPLAEGLKKTADWVATLSDEEMKIATKNK